jgi:hypothetical protein
MTCCTNILGPMPHNADVNLGVVAAQTGNHTFLIYALGSLRQRTMEFTAGDDLIVPKPWNEQMTYRVEIRQPDGTLFSNNDCTDFTFNTIVAIDETCGTEQCDEDTTSESYS